MHFEAETMGAKNREPNTKQTVTIGTEGTIQVCMCATRRFQFIFDDLK